MSLYSASVPGLKIPLTFQSAFLSWPLRKFGLENCFEKIPRQNQFLFVLSLNSALIFSTNDVFSIEVLRKF